MSIENDTIQYPHSSGVLCVIVYLCYENIGITEESPRVLFAPAEQYVYRKRTIPYSHSSGVLCVIVYLCYENIGINRWHAV